MTQHPKKGADTMGRPHIAVLGFLTPEDCVSVFGNVKQPLTLMFLSDETLHRYARSRGWGCMQYRPYDWGNCQEEIEQMLSLADAMFSVGDNPSVRHLCELRQIPFKVI